jgi:RNA polymerase sigma-70 factor (ECF subfamily)
MLLHHARRAARLDRSGDLVTLEDQDRGRWDANEITEATALLDDALREGSAGPYQLQAAIAACHATADRPEATDWVEIAGLYELLLELVPTPVVELNRAVAVAMARGLDEGLALVDQLESSRSLQSYYLLHATRADLLRRLERPAEAAVAYREALELVGSDAERRFLERRLAEVTAA